MSSSNGIGLSPALAAIPDMHPLVRRQLDRPSERQLERPSCAGS